MSSSPRLNVRAGRVEDVWADGVRWRFEPLKVAGEPVLYTVTGAVEEQLLADHAAEGGPLAGIDMAYVHEVCQKVVEDIYRDSAEKGLVTIPDASLRPWVRVSEHPRVGRIRQEHDAAVAVLAASDADGVRQGISALLPDAGAAGMYDETGAFSAVPGASGKPIVSRAPALFSEAALPRLLAALEAVGATEIDGEATGQWLCRDQAARSRAYELTPELAAEGMSRDVEARFEGHVGPHATRQFDPARKRSSSREGIVTEYEEVDIGGDEGADTAGW